MTVSLWMVTRWRVTTERPNDRRGGVASGTACNEGGGVLGGCGCASRVETAALSLVIARHQRWVEVREACRSARAGWASDATHSRVAGGVQSGAGCRSCDGPALGGASAGDGALLLGAAGGGEGGECVFDALSWEVALA
jgi:hypothetical protein